MKIKLQPTSHWKDVSYGNFLLGRILPLKNSSVGGKLISELKVERFKASVPMSVF